MIPDHYKWLAQEGEHPRMLFQGIALLGTIEFGGSKDNPVILAWARECSYKDYNHDSIPWCGLFMSLCAKRAGWNYSPAGNGLWAQNWLKWGIHQSTAMLGDVVIFGREGGGHVAMYVGEGDHDYHVLGGNQGDRVEIMRKPKTSALGFTRAPWLAQPSNIRQVFLTPEGAIK